jgi:hypothetical protein
MAVKYKKYVGCYVRITKIKNHRTRVYVGRLIDYRNNQLLLERKRTTSQCWKMKWIVQPRFKNESIEIIES